MSTLGLWDRGFSDLFEGLVDTSLTTTFSPKVEITEGEKEYRLIMEAPGMKKEDIHVEVKDDVIRLSGEKKTETSKKGENCSYSERSYGSFERTFRLPEGTEGDKIAAHYADGVLELKIPKGEAKKAKGTEVKIE
jgi:HSP20 family protein